MLTPGQTQALDAVMDRAKRMRGETRDWLSFVGSPFGELDAVCDIVRRGGFHIVDGELFRYRRVGTDEFCRLIEFEKHGAFALLLPCEIPFTLAAFLYNVADHQIVSTETSYSSGERYPSFAEKAWLAMMTPEDFEAAKLETGWDRTKLTRVLSDYCWLHDNRYERTMRW
jgi:hypothetical protein